MPVAPDRAFAAAVLLGLTACAASIPQSQRVRDVTILGRQDIDEDELTGGLANHPPAGLIFIDYAAYDPNTLKLDIKRVESFYRARGYFSAKVVDSRVDPQPDGVRINEGCAQCRAGEKSGWRETQPTAVRRLT